jgi:benzoate transport
MRNVSTSSPKSINHQSITELIQAKSGGYMHILVVVLCMLTNMLDGFDITAMAVVAGSVGNEMNIPPEKLGFAFSFSLAGMMFGAMFLASLSDTYGRRNVIIVSLGAIGISVLSTAFTSNLTELVILRFISGLGAGAMLASQATLTSEYSADKYRALCVAIVTAGYPLGAMMTGLVGQYIITDYGWRSMFILGGSLSIGMCFIIYFLLPESLFFLCNKKPKDALTKINRILAKYNVPQVDVLSEDSIETSLSEEKTEITNDRLWKRISQLFAGDLGKKTILLWSCFMLAMITMYFLMSWIPKLIVNAGFSSTTANYAFSMFNFGGVTGIFIMGMIAVRWQLSIVVSLFLTSSGVLMLLFAFTAHTELMIITLITLIGLSLQGGFTGLYALSAKLYPTEIRTTGVGWALGVGRLGAVFGPAIAGFTIASGIDMQLNYMLFAIPVLLSGIAIYKLSIR